jgi:hypothetical protein
VTLDPATAYKIELYDVQQDWTQYTDVAANKPSRVPEMTALMFGEFAKYQVLPLDDDLREIDTRGVSLVIDAHNCGGIRSALGH